MGWAPMPWYMRGSQRTIWRVSLLLQRGKQGSNSGCQVWWRVPLPTEPSHFPFRCFCYRVLCAVIRDGFELNTVTLAYQMLGGQMTALVVELGFQVVLSFLPWVLGTKLGPLEEQQVPFIVEPSLQSP